MIPHIATATPPPAIRAATMPDPFARLKETTAQRGRDACRRAPTAAAQSSTSRFARESWTRRKTRHYFRRRLPSPRRGFRPESKAQERTIVMAQIEQLDAPRMSLNERLEEHFATTFRDDWEVLQLSQHFRREGYVKIPNLVPPEIKTLVRDEVYRLLDLHARRIDILLKETGNTPRRMSTVSQQAIARDSTLIPEIYDSPALMAFLSRLARQPVIPCPWDEEKFVVIRQERKGDTHGWHWGDFSFTVIWIIEAPSR